MRFRIFLICVLTVLSACASVDQSARPPVNVLTEQEIAEGFELIFDGVNPDGWIGENWEIVRGSWIPEPETRGVLRTTSSWQNFHLRTSFYISGDKDSGIFIRCAPEDRVTPANCYQINIRDDHENFPTGSIVNIAAPDKRVRTKGAWNTMEVIADGANLKVLVNGVVTADIYDTRYAGPGNIAFQTTEEEGALRFRTIRLRSLD